MLTLLMALAAAPPEPVVYQGHLERGVAYALVGPGSGLLAELAPPTLQLPRHHAGRLEWANPDRLAGLSIARVRLVFLVEQVEIVRVSERRWNTTYHCRVLSLEPAPK